MIRYIHFWEIAAFLTGLVLSRRLQPGFLKWLVVLLFMTCLNESCIVPYIKAHKLFSRVIAYNIFSFLDMGCWLYIFTKLEDSPKRRQFLKIAALFIFGFSIWELCAVRNWHQLHFDSFRLYNMLVIYLCVSYFYGRLHKEFYDYRRDPFFYICSGSIIYQGILFINFTTQAEGKYWFSKGAATIFYILQDIASTIYYLLLCIAFIVSSSFYKPK